MFFGTVKRQHDETDPRRETLTIERVVELACWLGVAVFYISHLGVDTDLYSRILAILVELLFGRTDKRRVCVDDLCSHVEYTTNGYGVEERRRIERYKGRSSVGECRSCRERELECLFEEEATKDHKVVSIAVLWLHDGGRLQARRVHEMEVVGLTQLVMRVYIYQIE